MTGSLGEHTKVCTPLHLEESANPVHVRGDSWNIVRADSKLERTTMMKLDFLLVPLMCGLYLLAFLDRSNIGNARIAGLQTDLGISDHQYQIGMQINSPEGRT